MEIGTEYGHHEFENRFLFGLFYFWLIDGCLINLIITAHRIIVVLLNPFYLFDKYFLNCFLPQPAWSVEISYYTLQLHISNENPFSHQVNAPTETHPATAPTTDQTLTEDGVLGHVPVTNVTQRSA